MKVNEIDLINTIEVYENSNDYNSLYDNHASTLLNL